MWGLFNAKHKEIPPQEQYWLVEDTGTKFHIDKAYRDLGLTEGWLVLIDMHIDIWDIHHYKYRLA